LRKLSIWLWCAFPVVYIISELSLIGPLATEFLTSLLDLGAKMVYTLALFWASNLSFERLEMLQIISDTRCLEESGMVEYFMKSQFL
jgi:bacteriorhodopsin